MSNDLTSAQLIADVQSNAEYFEPRLSAALKMQDQTLLTLPPREATLGLPKGLASPIFPLFTPEAIPLARYLQTIGYDVQPIPYPAVPKGKERIRIIIHARNTREEMDGLIAHLVAWIKEKTTATETEAPSNLEAEPVKPVAEPADIWSLVTPFKVANAQVVDTSVK